MIMLVSGENRGAGIAPLTKGRKGDRQEKGLVDIYRAEAEEEKRLRGRGASVEGTVTRVYYQVVVTLRSR